jgi:translation initiation factor 4E
MATGPNAAETSLPSSPAVTPPTKSVATLSPLSTSAPSPASKQHKGILSKGRGGEQQQQPSSTDTSSASSPSVSSVSSPSSASTGSTGGAAPPSLTLSDADQSSSTSSLSSSAIPPAVSSSHRLHRQWTFHFSLPSNDKSRWDESAITPVVDVATVENFWFAYTAIAKPTTLPLRSDLHLFIKGIQPTWEEPANHHGGRWLVEYKRGEDEVLCAAWLSTLLALIGEAFTDSEEMMGVVLSVRKQKNKLQIWTKTGNRREETIRVGREWKEVIDYRGRIGYMTHEDSKKYSAEMKSRYEA